MLLLLKLTLSMDFIHLSTYIDYSLDSKDLRVSGSGDEYKLYKFLYPIFIFTFFLDVITCTPVLSHILFLLQTYCGISWNDSLHSKMNK